MVGHEELDWHGRCMGAVLAAQPAVASHLSAAYLWDLLRYQPETIHLTVSTARRSRPDFRIHKSLVQGVDLAQVDGVPVTSLARTQLDLAATLTSDRLGDALERSEKVGSLDRVVLEAVLARYPVHPGAGRLRRALAIYRDDPTVTRSRLEKRFRALVAEAGLPAPSMNYNVAGYEVDCYWQRERFAVELGVFETHGSRLSFEQDPVRQEELKLVGVEMIRITGARLDREHGLVLERLAKLLRQRGAESGAR